MKRFEVVPIDKIHVGDDRHRQDMGDIEGLAQSIRDLGLLQPVGVTKFYELVYGERRLHACIILNWTKVPCVVVDFDEILLGEYAENEFRKDFTASERVAIARKIAEDIGSRKGERTDLPAIAGKLKGETVDITARRSGFKSADTLQRAQTVVDEGAPELVAAMDSGEVSISAAEVIATTIPDKQKQAEVVAMPKDKRKQVVKDAREELERKRQMDAKTAAYQLRRYIEMIAKTTVPVETMWSLAAEYSWPEFTTCADDALRYLSQLRESHPNAQKRLRRNL